MCGAGKAIGVLTSGGDAQGGRGAGSGTRRRARGGGRGRPPAPGPSARTATLPGTRGPRLPRPRWASGSRSSPRARGPRTCRAPRLRAPPLPARGGVSAPAWPGDPAGDRAAGAGLAAVPRLPVRRARAPVRGASPETCFPAGRAERRRSPQTWRASSSWFLQRDLGTLPFPLPRPPGRLYRPPPPRPLTPDPSLHPGWMRACPPRTAPHAAVRPSGERGPGEGALSGA